MGAKGKYRQALEDARRKARHELMVRVVEARKAGLTQAEIAEAEVISQVLVSKIEAEAREQGLI